MFANLITFAHLSFPKSYPVVLMVQPGQGWDGDNDTGPGSPDPVAHPWPTPNACAPDCNMPHTTQELAVSAPHPRSAFGPGTRGARCRSGVPHDHFAAAIQARSVGRGCPWRSRGT